MERDYRQYEIESLTRLLPLFFLKKKEEIEIVVKLPNEFVSLANKGKSVLSSKSSKKLSESRGITDEDILFWKIGFCTSGEYAGRIIIPSFNENGDCNYFIGRTYQNDWRKYMNPPTAKSKIIFNELYIDWDEDLTLTEGVFDAIIAGKNSVPILGSSLREQSKLFKSIIANDTPVYIALDLRCQEKSIKFNRKLNKIWCGGI